MVGFFILLMGAKRVVQVVMCGAYDSLRIAFICNLEFIVCKGSSLSWWTEEVTGKIQMVKQGLLPYCVQLVGNLASGHSTSAASVPKDMNNHLICNGGGGGGLNKKIDGKMPWGGAAAATFYYQTLLSMAQSFLIFRNKNRFYGKLQFTVLPVCFSFCTGLGWARQEVRLCCKKGKKYHNMCG